MTSIDRTFLTDPNLRRHVLELNSRLVVEEPSPSLQNSAETTHNFGLHNILLRNKNFLLTNFLSVMWRVEWIKDHPSCYFYLPFVYLGGMVGYAFSLPCRVYILVFQCLDLIATLFGVLLRNDRSFFWDDLKEGVFVLLGGIGELSSASIGVVCPPLAYKIDERIQNIEIIHIWYFRHLFSMWKNELIEEPNSEGDIGFGGDVGNEERIAIKEKALKPFWPYFNKAKEDLGEYLSEEEIEGMIGSIHQITFFGLLDIFCSDKKIDFFIQTESVYIKFKKKWDAFLNQYYQPEMLSQWLKVKLLLAIDDKTNIQTYYKKGFETLKDLKKLNEAIPAKSSQDINDLFVAFNNFFGDFSTNDKESFGLITKEVFKLRST